MSKTRKLAYAAVLAAVYVALCHTQNLLLPGSASMAIQFRVSEALCVFAFFSPFAVTGLTVGCFLFNISNAGVIALDIIVGTAATFLSVEGMYLTRKITVKGYPLIGMIFPVICNAILVGWELAVCVGGGFWLNALYVGIGEAAVIFTLGNILYYIIKMRRFARWEF